MRVIEIPHRGRLELAHLVLDLNGTIANRGVVIDGVAERLARLREQLDIHVLSADTFSALEAIGRELDVRARAISRGREKALHVTELGASHCVAIGNGANDEAMLEAAALGIAVVGPEGAAGAAIRAADIVCSSILAALDLLLDDRVLVATLRQ